MRMLTPAHDWSSYDRIVDRYDERWGGRFEAVARQIWTIIRPQSGVRALDIGTGSGIVPRALPAVVTDVGLAVGCDPSLAMLRQAANRVSNLHLISADAAALPFADRTFDVVTASFVLSHVADYSTALAESHRVLRPGGALAVSNWLTVPNPHSSTWSELLSRISPDLAQRALAVVAPSENPLSQDGELENAVRNAGFDLVTRHTLDVATLATPESWIADRELDSGGRLASSLLTPDDWLRFKARAVLVMRQRFGEWFQIDRRALIVTARRPV
jgi:ubiquinone/menaquinone biosynthesis C-methylase UbiE